MNRTTLKAAVEDAITALSRLADELNEQPAAGASAPQAPAPAAPLPPRKPQESAFTECPAHRQPFKEGKFGLFCTGQSDDPNWSNDRGYCKVTPRSAGAWLRQHPKGSAPAPQDVDDVPF